MGRETEPYQRAVRRVDRCAETLGLPRRNLLWQCGHQGVAASGDLSLSEHQVNESFAFVNHRRKRCNELLSYLYLCIT